MISEILKTACGGLRVSARAGRRALPAAAFLTAALIVTGLLPVSQTLWATVLGIDAEVTTGEFGGHSQGCTPGFWKQDQHFNSWPAQYSPDDLFWHVVAVEGSEEDPVSLLEVLWLQGGQLNSLMRHAVAGLLNAASDEINYPYSSQEVIDLFLDGLVNDPEPPKTTLELANAIGCPFGDNGPIEEDATIEPTPTGVVAELETETPTPTEMPTEAGSETPTVSPTPQHHGTNPPGPTSTSVPTALPSPTSSEEPTDPSEGCAVGYWADEEVLAEWAAGYQADDRFGDVFERDLDDDVTLLEALNSSEDGLYDLARQAVAALLNAEHPDLDFPYAPEVVIDIFQQAYDSEDETRIEALADLLEEYNDADCPLETAQQSDTPIPTPEDAASPAATDSLDPTLTPPPTDTPTDSPTSTELPTDTPTPIPSATPPEDTPEP